MKKTLCLMTCLAASGFARAGVIEINFDDRPARATPVPIGDPVPPEFVVNDEYLSLGILFDSGGDGVWLSRGSNPVSPPNVACPSGPGTVFGFAGPSEMTFWLDGAPGRVDFVSAVLTGSSDFATLTAYVADGVILGTSIGGPSATLIVTFPGLIHSAVLTGNSYAFDNVRFDGLVPAPSATALLVIGGSPLARRRRRGAPSLDGDSGA